MKRKIRFLLRALAVMLLAACLCGAAAGAYAESVQREFRVATPDEPDREPVSQFDLSVSQSGGRITAVITGASSREVEISFSVNGSRAALLSLIGSGSVTTGVLGPGVYTVTAAYVTPAQGVSPVSRSIEIPAAQVTPTPTPTPKPTPTPTPVIGKKGITITLVIGGENQLVVCGNAQPNTEVTITTNPGTGTHVVRSDAGGSYAAAIACRPGTYTAVAVKYADDASSRVRMTGSFVVTGNSVTPTPVPLATPTPPPTQDPVRPPFRVDPVGHKSVYVNAYSTPGTIVNLSVQGYGQTLTADSSGRLVYTLPQTYPKGTVMTFTIYYDSTKTTSYTFRITVGASSHYRTLTHGAYGEDVLMLTERLQQLGYPITPTMTCTRDVMYAVRLFQQRNGLTVDGLAGEKTQNRLYSVHAVGMEGDPQEYPFGTLRRSTRYNAAVVPMQKRLRELGYPVGKADGYFGSQTYRAVMYFQRVNGISPANGVADPSTLQLLYSALAKRYNGRPVGEEEDVIVYRLLYWGSEGEHVRRLQSALLAAGYTQVRVVDGIYGKWTYDAVVAFQRDHNLLVDGIAGKQTQNALYGTNF